MRIVSAALLLALASPALAAPGVPVRVRVIKGSREQPAQVDPRLADLKTQLSSLSYLQWAQVTEQELDMDFKKPADITLPDGAKLTLTLVESRKDTVTFDVSLPGHKTHSKLTISKDKRIVHQVSDEKAGVAYFASVRPWP